MAADGRPVASTLTMARSVSVSMPHTLPDRTRPSLSSTSNFSPPSTTWWLVRIQPLLSKMTPDPTPVSGITPLFPTFAVPVTVIRTTAGLTLEATAIVADDSSIATGWTVPTLVAWGALAAEGEGRSSAPTADRAATVPTDASTADRRQASTSEPPRRERFGAVTGAVEELLGAGSYQRSGVTGVLSLHERAHSARGSGLGV